MGGTSDKFRFATDGNGNYGYVKKVSGADTWFPFSGQWFVFYATNSSGGYYYDSYGKQYGDESNKIAISTLLAWIDENSEFMDNITWNYNSGIFSFTALKNIITSYPVSYGIGIQSCNSGSTWGGSGMLNYMAYGAGIVGVATN